MANPELREFMRQAAGVMIEALEATADAAEKQAMTPEGPALAVDGAAVPPRPPSLALRLGKLEAEVYRLREVVAQQEIVLDRMGELAFGGPGDG